MRFLIVLAILVGGFVTLEGLPTTANDELAPGLVVQCEDPCQVADLSPITLGDVNCDGKASVIDALAILQVEAGLPTSITCGEDRAGDNFFIVYPLPQSIFCLPDC